jgi:hypothetical protein
MSRSHCLICQVILTGCGGWPTAPSMTHWFSAAAQTPRCVSGSRLRWPNPRESKQRPLAPRWLAAPGMRGSDVELITMCCYPVTARADHHNQSDVLNSSMVSCTHVSRGATMPRLSVYDNYVCLELALANIRPTCLTFTDHCRTRMLSCAVLCHAVLCCATLCCAGLQERQ